MLVWFSVLYFKLCITVDAGEGDKTLEMSCTNYIQGVEEVQYRLNEWMKDNVEPCLYGIGNTLSKAFDNYKERLLKAQV